MSRTRRSVVVHGHFYQPPREDPWTREVPVEPSAAPFHDWNARVHAECYRAVVAARILDGRGRIAEVLNALEWMSWDAGPTLLSWLAREQPATYRAFLDADTRSVARLGHGGALAAPYHHVILPLATRRDKVTEVRWGMADFRRRFGREPEGMWLPETAVDTETLEVLAAEGIRFTVLGPGQVTEAPEDGSPGRVDLPSGRSIAVFVYDGGLSHDVAFGELLRDAHAWAERMATEGGGARRLASLATDGETFGHHHRWGDMALAAALAAVRDRGDVRLENYASWLARSPAETAVRIVEPSAWSCAHGVDRWRADCGCKMAPDRPSQQKWRRVLRVALEGTANALHERFERETGVTFSDPWAVRDAYGAMLDAGDAAVRRFLEETSGGPLSDDRAAALADALEMERDALRMFTSCGWFFDDLAGIEALQVLRYAAHALDLGGPEGSELEARLVRALARARSNDPEEGNGRSIWERRVRGTGEAHDRSVGDEGSRAIVRTPPSAATPLAAEVRLAAAVERFVRDPEPGRAAEVSAAAEALGGPTATIPFDVQTTFARSLAGLRDRAPEPARLVAQALGFGAEALDRGGRAAAAPVGFVFGVHVHQPVGNFEEVFRSHTDDVYLPLLRKLAERDALPIALHVSGPLLEWLERDGHEYLDLVGRLAADGAVELLASGLYEPVLPVLPRADRIEQVRSMGERLRARFGVEARGLWLTERVWEPGLVEDLAEAGVEYAFVDDRHFLVTGFEPSELHRGWCTESGGARLSLLPIDQRLRYLIPFRPVDEVAEYFRTLHAEGRPLAILADDGEKFGGWPGTADWVWTGGWLDRWLDTLDRLRDEGTVVPMTPSQALGAHPPAGPAYLPSASYHEMEAWSLPPAAARRLERLELVVEEHGEPRAGTLLRGGHWRNFLTRYTESNRMHKKASTLSALCRERGDPEPARRAIARAQCNDAYWHGVFGGLYLRHLRAAVWANLAEAEEVLRRGQPLRAETVDVDADGADEVWIHSGVVSVVVAPARGGAVEEFARFARGANLADTLTRRRESYHREDAPAPAAAPRDDDGGMPSIHALEEALRFRELPPFDLDDRALFVDRVLASDVTPEAYARADYTALESWARTRMEAHVRVDDTDVAVTLRTRGGPALEKRVVVDADGTVRVSYRWDASGFPEGACFAPELSMAEDVSLELDPEPEDVWRYEIRTVSKSERGTDEAVQGVSVTPRWPCVLGEASVTLRWS